MTTIDLTEQQLFVSDSGFEVCGGPFWTALHPRDYSSYDEMVSVIREGYGLTSPLVAVECYVYHHDGVYMTESEHPLLWKVDEITTLRQEAFSNGTLSYFFAKKEDLVMGLVGDILKEDFEVTRREQHAMHAYDYQFLVEENIMRSLCRDINKQFIAQMPIY